MRAGGRCRCKPALAPLEACCRHRRCPLQDDTWNLERLCVLNLGAKGHTRALADLMRRKTLPKHLVPPAGGELFSAAFERFLSSRPELFKLTQKEGGALHVSAMPGEAF